MPREKKKTVAQMADEADRQMDARPDQWAAVTPPDYGRALSTGSTLLDLALTGRLGCGWVPGSVNHFFGDSSSGKTYFTLAAFAEAANSPLHDDWALVFDAPERGAQMDLADKFGAKMAARLRPPSRHADGRPRPSRQVEDFQYYCLQALKTRCLYVLDSVDALFSLADEQQALKVGVAVRRRDRKEDRGKEAAVELKGSYATDRAKKLTGALRLIEDAASRSGSVVILISQAKADLQNPYTTRKTYSGGVGLTYFPQVQVYSKVLSPLTHERGNDEKIHVGNLCRFYVTKNRYTGQNGHVDVPIRHSIGIDDLYSCVDFLVGEGVWKKKVGGVIEAQGLPDGAAVSGRMEDVIAQIEAADLEPSVKGAVAGAWAARAAEGAVKRKKKYL
jgi:RecA/RadA recombinase